jgi:hypothetical protein
MKQIWIGILNQLNSGDIPSSISILYSSADIKMPYDPSFAGVKDLLCEKIQIIINNLPDEPNEPTE